MKEKRRIQTAGLCVLLLLLLLLSLTAFAADRYRNITSVRITIDSSLAEITADEYLPSISAGDFSVPDSANYFVSDAEWYNESSDELSVGDQPKAIIYLEAKYGKSVTAGGDDIYYRFSGSYNSTNVKVTNGSFVSARRRNQDELEVVVKLKGVKGTYEAPEQAWWGNTRGAAYWSRPEVTSGYYEVVLKRGTSTVVSMKTNGTSLNLYPWMTREGDYSFEVRTIPYTDEQKKYGERSDFAYSEELYITDETKSNGNGKYSTTGLVDRSGSSGNTGNAAHPGNGGPSPESTTEAGWIKSGNSWYFKYPNGELLKDQWLKWNDKWYHFDASGLMQTGWYQNAAGNWFYLNKPNGDMRTGWLNENGSWYFLNPTKDDWEGSMIHSRLWDYNGRKYYFDDSGRMVTGWVSMKDENGVEQFYYFYPENKVEGAFGYMAVNTTVDGFVVDANGRWVH